MRLLRNVKGTGMGVHACSECHLVHGCRIVAAVHVLEQAVVLHQCNPMKIALVYQGAADELIGYDSLVLGRLERAEEQLPTCWPGGAQHGSQNAS